MINEQMWKHLWKESPRPFSKVGRVSSPLPFARDDYRDTRLSESLGLYFAACSVIYWNVLLAGEDWAGRCELKNLSYSQSMTKMRRSGTRELPSNIVWSHILSWLGDAYLWHNLQWNTKGRKKKTNNVSKSYASWFRITEFVNLAKKQCSWIATSLPREFQGFIIFQSLFVFLKNLRISHY